MKKQFYLWGIVAFLTACGNTGYKVTGTVEGAAEGDTIYLSCVGNGNFVNLDSTVIRNGKFTFEGRQDTAVNRYIRTKNKVGDTNRRLYTDFFLENGKIQVDITQMGGTTSGTPNNDAYQAARNDMYNRQQELQKLSKEEQMKAFNDAFTGVMKGAAAKYIHMPVGVHFLKEAQHFMDIDELDTLLSQIPEGLASDPVIVRMKEKVAQKKNCAVGRPFVDLTMQDPEGKEVKLSDYAGKGKVLMIDFWASWCGPCCRAIPGLIEIYNQYKDKGFEIVGISLDQDVEAWKKAIERLNIPWPQMSDLKGWKCEGARLYAVGTVPYTVLIDAEGKIMANNLEAEDLKKVLDETLKN